jgi:cell division ATPase FtsA
MRRIDEVQRNVMECLRDCGLQPNEVMDIMLSIALSIARETEREPGIVLKDRAEKMLGWWEKGNGGYP